MWVCGCVGVCVCMYVCVCMCVVLLIFFPGLCICELLNVHGAFFKYIVLLVIQC